LLPLLVKTPPRRSDGCEHARPADAGLDILADSWRRVGIPGRLHHREMRPVELFDRHYTILGAKIFGGLLGEFRVVFELKRVGMLTSRTFAAPSAST